MIKGYSKRVIVIKNPSGDYFDEAYFILKERFSAKNYEATPCETKMIDEANRIIADNMMTKFCAPHAARKKENLKFSTTAVFVMGMATACLIITMCKLVLF